MHVTDLGRPHDRLEAAFDLVHDVRPSGVHGHDGIVSKLSGDVDGADVRIGAVREQPPLPRLWGKHSCKGGARVGRVGGSPRSDHDPVSREEVGRGDRDGHPTVVKIGVAE